MGYDETLSTYTRHKTRSCRAADHINHALYSEYGVKRGLRDENGKGVLTGLTNISSVISFKTENGVPVPCPGELLYRGYPIEDLIRGSLDSHFGFEEAAYLLLFGNLPTPEEKQEFCNILVKCRNLPTNFTRDVIMKAPSADIMNSMTRSVLTLASYDRRATDLDLANVLRQCIQLISTFPMLAVYAYHSYNHYNCDQSMYIHRPDPALSTGENFLRLLRPDQTFTPLEAKVLDVALILHMEHGGGNNSTFTTRVVTSSGSDTYSAMAAALSSLKGPRHGGANIMVMRMMEDIRQNVTDAADEDAVRDYLGRLLTGEAFDRKGLIYGMGHAVYSLSDPREMVLEHFVERLAVEKHRERDMALYRSVENLAPALIAEHRKIYKGVSPNVDFYSGFVYDMLGIPVELFTPLFAIARVVGWSAHRMEELISRNKIIRPAYMSLCTRQEYLPIDARQPAEAPDSCPATGGKTKKSAVGEDEKAK